MPLLSTVSQPCSYFRVLSVCLLSAEKLLLASCSLVAFNLRLWGQLFRPFNWKKGEKRKKSTFATFSMKYLTPICVTIDKSTISQKHVISFFFLLFFFNFPMKAVVLILLQNVTKQKKGEKTSTYVVLRFACLMLLKQIASLFSPKAGYRLECRKSKWHPFYGMQMSQFVFAISSTPSISSSLNIFPDEGS